MAKDPLPTILMSLTQELFKKLVADRPADVRGFLRQLRSRFENVPFHSGANSSSPQGVEGKGGSNKATRGAVPVFDDSGISTGTFPNLNFESATLKLSDIGISVGFAVKVAAWPMP